METLLKASDYLKKRLILCQKGQSTLEYAMVMVIAGIISAVLVAVANREKIHRIPPKFL